MHLSEPSGTVVSEPNNEEIIALRDDAGNSYLVEIKDEHIKIKGVGVFNPLTTSVSYTHLTLPTICSV